MSNHSWCFALLLRGIPLICVRPLVDLDALAWLEDCLQTWPGTDRSVRLDENFGTLGALCFFRSHDRAFLDTVATDIIHQHSGRLDYYKGYFTDIDSQSPLLRRTLAISRSSIQQNPSGSETCGASTKRR